MAMLVMPVSARFAEDRLRATLVVPINVVSDGFAFPLARSYAAFTEAGTAAVLVEVLEVEFSSWTAPFCAVVPS